MPQGSLMQGTPGFVGQPFMTSPGNMPGNMPGMQQVPPSGGTMSGPMGMQGNLPTLGQMQLPQGPLLGNFNQLPPQGRTEPERSGPSNMTMPNLGMMPMWPDGQRSEPVRPPMAQAPMAQAPCGNLGEGNQIGQQMAILAGGLPPPSGQVMGAFCAQLLGNPQQDQLPRDKAPEPGPGPGMDPLRPPWMLQELANAAVLRDLDGPSMQGNSRPLEMPNSNQTPLLTLQQQQQLILQQLGQSSQPGPAALPSQLPSQLGFCGMNDLGQNPNHTAPAPAPSIPQFQNQPLRMQGSEGESVIFGWIAMETALKAHCVP